MSVQKDRLPFWGQCEPLSDGRFHLDNGPRSIRRDVDGATMDSVQDEGAVVHSLLRGCYEGCDGCPSGPAVGKKVSESFRIRLSDSDLRGIDESFLVKQASEIVPLARISEGIVVSNTSGKT